MCNKPEDLNLNGVDIIAIDLETYDPNLKSKGTGAIRQDGFITGVAVCTKNETVYFPLQHSDTQKTEEAGDLASSNAGGWPRQLAH